MLALFTFTPTESKHLIAKAVADMEKVQNAFNNGILAMHPSSSTHFIPRELTGRDHTGKVWVTGTVVPKALCVEERTGAGTGQLTKSLADPGMYPHTVVFYKGKEQKGWNLYDLMEKMGPGDIYIKGVNSVDINYSTGVLLGSMKEGTIAKMVKASKEKGFEVLVPVGLEKLIPISMKEAANFINRNKDYSMGVKCSMFIFDADMTITEVEALQMLTGGKAMPFSCGGLGGAEGAVSIAIEGSENQIEKAVEICESVKGSALPEVISPVCETCQMPTCFYNGTKKPWINKGGDK